MLGRFGRVGLRTYEAKSDVAALDYNSRLRGGVKFLSSYSELTQNLRPIGYFVYLPDFRVPSNGSVSDVRGQSPVKPRRTFPRKSGVLPDPTKPTRYPNLA